jgi:hypothetical protein
MHAGLLRSRRILILTAATSTFQYGNFGQQEDGSYTFHDDDGQRIAGATHWSDTPAA